MGVMVILELNLMSLIDLYLVVTLKFLIIFAIVTFIKTIAYLLPKTTKIRTHFYVYIKILTDTIPRPARKRNERILVPFGDLLGQKPFRIVNQRIRISVRIAVQVDYRYRDAGLRRYNFIAQIYIAGRLSTDHWGDRQQSLRFADAHLQVVQVADVVRLDLFSFADYVQDFLVDCLL